MAPKKKAAVLAKIDEVEAGEVKAKVAKLTKDSVSSEMAKLAVTLNNALGDVSARYQETLTTLEGIQKTISLENAELERLRNIKVEADTLANLEAEIEEKRNAWAREQDEESENRDREEKEFEYNRKEERKREENSYQEKKALRDKEFLEREMKIHAAEKELVELKNLRDNLDKIKQDFANEKLKAQATAMSNEYKHQMEIANANANAEKMVMNQTVASLQAQVQALHNQNEILRSDLDKARNDAKEVATKALEASANKSTIDALQKAMETNASAGSKK